MEIKFCQALPSWKEPILPCTMFLMPNEEIITSLGGKPLFPEFATLDKTLKPESLPSKIKLLCHNINNYKNHPIKQKGFEIIPEIASGDPPKLVDAVHEDDVVIESDKQADDSNTSNVGDKMTELSGTTKAQDLRVEASPNSNSAGDLNNNPAPVLDNSRDGKDHCCLKIHLDYKSPRCH